MDSELQDALDASSEVLDDGRRAIREEHLKPIVEAARKVANPDIKAVANELVRLDVIASPSVARDLARLLVDAALGVTEAPDGQ